MFSSPRSRELVFTPDRELLVPEMHYTSSPQISTACPALHLLRHSFSRLCVVHHNDYSARTFFNPRDLNRTNSRITIFQNTTSIVDPHCLYVSLPLFVNSFRSMRSLADNPLGIRLRGDGAPLIALE